MIGIAGYPIVYSVSSPEAVSKVTEVMSQVMSTVRKTDYVTILVG